MQSSSGCMPAFSDASLHMIDYYIPDYVHFALESDTAVFMDIRADQYRMLVGPKARAFNQLLSHAAHSGHRAISVDRLADETRAFQDDLVAELLANGILTTQKVGSKNPIPALIPLPEENLLGPHTSDSIAISILDVCTFLVACVSAKWRLTCWRIENTIRDVEGRKRKAARRQFDIHEARRLVRIYNRLRPLIPMNYLCLFDSLSLLNFLAARNCYPTWVFAVQLEPWTAHCWVQYGT